MISEPVGFFAGLNTPLAMLIIGSYVAKVDIYSFVSDKAVYKMAALRLLAAPGLFLLLLLLIRPEPELLVTSVIQAACPVAAKHGAFCRAVQVRLPLASKTVAVSTVLSILTIPLFTILAQGAVQWLY